ncbi:MAG: 3-hydroxyacyl-CoA dehydrogenase/enoyl-CoA hydratase family protein [bacterium]
MDIKTITVIGSGVMGSGVAAHLVNAGFSEVYLLDILPPRLTDEQIRNGYTLENRHIRNIVARKNLNALIKSKPPQLGLTAFEKNITIGNTTDDFDRFVSASDWIIEVVPEVVTIKNETFKLIDKVRKPDAIVSSNTSGISIKEMLDGCSDQLKAHFLITHFFNPVRFMKLLEIVSGEKTRPEVVATIEKLGQERLGKGIVHSFDVPAFVGNRIGVYDMMYLMTLTPEYGIETINNIFDKKLGYGGKPFSTCDLVGLDTLSHVVRYIYDSTHDESHEVFRMPAFVTRLVETGRLGRKSGAGFFKREKLNGKKVDFVINPETNEYVPKKNPKLKSVGEIKKARSVDQAIQMMYEGKDVGGEIYRRNVNELVRYTFARASEISPDGIEAVDNAIRWGFNRKYGPGQILDIIGVDRVVKHIEKEAEVPELLKELYYTGKNRVYTTNGAQEDMVFKGGNRFERVKRPDKYLTFKEIAKKAPPILKIEKGGRVFDLGDDILAVEMLSRNGTINMEVIEAIGKALDLAEKNACGLIVGNDLENFSFGADLDMLLGYALRGKTGFIEDVIINFQMLNHRLKFAKVPVVVTKRGMALGGGCELGFGAHIRAAHDSYIGLVEFGVGLIPGGGGTKEILVRKYQKYAQKKGSRPIDYIKEAFQQIAFVKVSTSAHEAKALGYLSETDGISMNSDFLLYDAKEDIKRLSKNYRPPEETYVPLPGRDMKATLYTGIDLAKAARQLPPMKVPNFIRTHMELVAKTLADVVSGGDVLPPGRKFSELELLEKERQAFLRLTTELSLKEKFSWLQIAAGTLKKKAFPWAFKSVKNSYFNHNHHNHHHTMQCKERDHHERKDLCCKR